MGFSSQFSLIQFVIKRQLSLFQALTVRFQAAWQAHIDTKVCCHLTTHERPNNQDWDKAFVRPANRCDVIVASTRDDTSGGPPSRARQTIETIRVTLKCIPLLITHSFPVVHSIRKAFQKTLYIKPLHL